MAERLRTIVTSATFYVPGPESRPGAPVAQAVPPKSLLELPEAEALRHLRGGRAHDPNEKQPEVTTVTPTMSGAGAERAE
jgi:hypothetical protein